MSTKILTVFGATGNQGGSVIRAVLANQKLASIYKIRAVTRDAKKPAAVALAEKGVEVVVADLDESDTLDAAVKGSDAVFGVTDFWETMNAETEIKQGKAIVDACKTASVTRFIFSSLVSTSRASAQRPAGTPAYPHVPHFDSKADVEAYAREQQVPSTFVIPGVFMNVLLDSFRRGDGTWATPLPLDRPVVPVTDVTHDMGHFVAAVLVDIEDKGAGKDEYFNRTLAVAAAFYSPRQLAEGYGKVTGKDAGVKPISYETFGGFLPPDRSEGLVATMKLMEYPGYYIGASEDLIDESIKFVLSKGEKGPSTWEEFLQKHAN